MTDLSAAVSSVPADAVLGVIFFGGLWWTIRGGIASATPAFYFLASSVLRTSLVIGGIHLVAADDWRRAVGCLVGFLLARTVMISLRRRVATRVERTVGSPP